MIASFRRFYSVLLTRFYSILGQLIRLFAPLLFIWLYRWAVRSGFAIFCKFGGVSFFSQRIVCCGGSAVGASRGSGLARKNTLQAPCVDYRKDKYPPPVLFLTFGKTVSQVSYSNIYGGYSFMNSLEVSRHHSYTCGRDASVPIDVS